MRTLGHFRISGVAGILLCVVNVVLANYTYDGLGRRITFNDPVAGFTTRYYYDGQSSIEERNGACPGPNCDNRVRYHINGNQFIDEHVATFTVATGQFTYYLSNANYSIAGTGNADGSVIERLNYSATGDFAGGGPGASAFYHDADDDLDIDLRDFASIQNCFGLTTAPCLTIHDFDTSDASDGAIDLDDYARFSACSNGPFVTPDQACGIPQRAGMPVVSGVFTLHGRPADILSDGHALMDFRARNYFPALGRWLQRDPLAYNDGFNLYEPFLNNPLSNLDPLGEGIVTALLVGDPSLSDAQFIREGGLGQAIRGFFGGGAQAAGNVAIGAAKGARELGYTVVDIVVAPVDIASTLIFNEPLGRPLSQVGQAATNADDLGRLIATTGSRNVLNAVTAGGFNVVEGTVIYVQTGDAETFSQNVGGQGLLTLGTVGAVRGVTAGRAPTLAAVRAQQLRVNVARGELGEINALALQRSLGETIVRTQFPQGAALRGFESVSAVETAQGLRVFVNEVKASPGNIVSGRFSALGLNRPQTFFKNLEFAQAQVAAQVTTRALRDPILQALQERSFTIRIIGPPGIRITPQTQVRINQVTGAPVEILDILEVP